MAVIRVNKTKNYTVMSNTHLKEKEMSLKAKGLLTLMLSLPDEWDYSINGLVAICKENQTSIRSALMELEQFGYLVRQRKQDEKGRFDYEYNIYESPQTENPYIDKPYIENPHTVKRTQLNTNELNIKKLNTKQANKKDIYISEFEQLWALYPNKKGKDKALSCYIKARNKGVEFETVKQGILDYSKECEIKKREKQYIQHGSTWFNNSGWNDEYDFTAPYQAQQGYQRQQPSGNVFLDLAKDEGIL